MIESPDELAAILRREYDAADHYYEQIEPLMEAAFRFYEAQPFGNEVDGRSQIVLPDVQETCDYMNQSVLRTFLSGDRVIEFEATDEADMQAADDATEAIDYRFMCEQDGAGVLGDVLQDGNLKMIGVFKALCDYEEKVSRRWETMPAEALGMLPDDMQVEDVREADDGMVRVLVKTQTTTKQHKLVAVPVNEFRFSANAKNEDDAGYVAHVRPAPRSELVAMGFDRDQVETLPQHSRWDDNESDDRDFHMTEASTQALEEVLLCEEYARIDVDGDGIAERVKVFRVENEILRWQGEPMGEDENGEPLFAEGEVAIETVDEQPFAVFCPFPRPHRMVGYALAQKVMDIQFARSEAARQLFDGQAYSNMPRPIVAENGSSEETLDDLLNPIPGSPIRVRDMGAVSMAPNYFDVSKSLSVMEWLTGERESRTGITRLNQGLDADALNKTATGTAMMQAAGQLFEEAIAYQLANAFRRGALKLYRMMRVEAEPFRIMVEGKPRMVDPSTWPESVNVRIRVGLGTNSKDKRIAARMALQEPMVLLKQEGLAGPEHVFHWMDGVARDMGIGKGEDYMFNPADSEVQQRMAAQAEQPDPEVAAKQAEIEAKKFEAEADRELRAAEAEIKLSLIEREAALKGELEERKQQREMALAEYKAEREFELARMKMAFDAEAKANMADQRMGGSVAS